MISEEAWNYIKTVFKDQGFIKEKLVFAASSNGKAIDMAKEFDITQKSGFEQLNPEKMGSTKPLGDN